jgi:hypothetical protein
VASKYSQVTLLSLFSDDFNGANLSLSKNFKINLYTYSTDGRLKFEVIGKFRVGTYCGFFLHIAKISRTDRKK